MDKREGVPSLIVATVIWGSTFPLIKLLMGKITPLSYVIYRSLAASLPLLPLTLIRRLSLPMVSAGLVLGILYFFGLYLQALGITYTTSSNAAFITSFSVPLVCVLETLFLKRKPSRTLILSMLIAVTGITLLSLNLKSFVPSIGDLIVLLSTIFWAFQIIYVDKYSKKYGILLLTSLELAFSGVIGTCIGALSLEKLDFLKWNDLIIVLYLSLVCSDVACLLQVYGQRSTSSTQAAIIYTLEPVFATIFAAIILREALSNLQYIGAFLVLIATYLATKAKVVEVF